MGCRNETETLRVRVAALERDLADAHDTIDRLTGAVATDPGRAATASRVIDAPSQVRLVRELDLTVSAAGLEAIASLLRERAEQNPRIPYTLSQVGGTLSAPGFDLSQRDGKIQLTMTADYRGAAKGVLAAGILFGGFLSIITMSVLHDGFGVDAGHLGWLLPLLIVLTGLFSRSRIGRRVRDRDRAMRGTFEAVVELAKRHRAGPARVRVHGGEEASQDGDQLLDQVARSSGYSATAT